MLACFFFPQAFLRFKKKRSHVAVPQLLCAFIKNGHLKCFIDEKGEVKYRAVYAEHFGEQ